MNQRPSTSSTPTAEPRAGETQSFASRLAGRRSSIRRGLLVFLGVAPVLFIGGGSLTQSLEAVRMHGFIGLVGFVGGSDANLPLTRAILKRVQLQGISVASLEAHERMVTAIEACGMEPVIDRIFGFGQLREAFAYLAAGRHFGKVAIDFRA